MNILTVRCCALNIDVKMVSKKVCLGLEEEGVEAPRGEEGGQGGHGGKGEGGKARVWYTPHHGGEAVSRA